MKKIKQRISTVLPTAKIFLDDLEEIDKILKESCSSYNITFNELNENELNSTNVTNLIKEVEKLLEGAYSFYTITLDEYELNSINEIKEIEEKQDFYSLEITLTKPYFHLEIDKFETYIYSEQDSLCLGIIERIKPIIEKRRKTYFQGWFDSKFIVFTTKKSNEQGNYFVKNKDELITKLFFGIITTAIGIFLAKKLP